MPAVRKLVNLVYSCCVLAVQAFSVCLPAVCRLRKLMYRVVFPFQLKLCNTSDDCPDVDTMYNLFAVIVHIGSGLHHGESG